MNLDHTKGTKTRKLKRKVGNYLDWNGYKTWFSYREEKEARKKVKAIGA